MSVVKRILERLVVIFFWIYFFVFGKPKLNKHLERTLRLYKNYGFSELFQLIRVWDAPFEKIDRLIPRKGTITDLGSGDGLLVNFLAYQKSRKLLGIEINPDRNKLSNKGLRNVNFRKADILSSSVPKSDALLLVDVLHHLPSPSSQVRLLRKCKGSLKKNGLLIIAEIAEKPLLKYLFTMFTDMFTVPILFESKYIDTSFHYRRTNEWLKILEGIGFKCRVIQAHQNKPFSHVIIECRQARMSI